MKRTQKLVGVALLATVAAGLAAPSVSQAAPNVTGTGKVTFSQQDLTENPDNHRPGEDGKDKPIIEKPDQNPDPLALKIISVTDMNFDTHNIEANDSNKTYKALPLATKDVNTGNDVKSAHFVRFRDVRADTATNFHTVSGKMTKQFTNGAFVLDGATLTYKNISLVTGTNSATLPSSAVLGGTTQDLALNVKKDFLVNREATKGFGVFELMFDTNEKAETTTYDGVDLNVLGTNVIKQGEYTGEITWTIEDAN